MKKVIIMLVFLVLIIGVVVLYIERPGFFSLVGGSNVNASNANQSSNVPTNTNEPTNKPVNVNQPVTDANIKVSTPTAGELVGDSFTIKGEARVFENQFAWRVRDANGKIIVDGSAYASAPDVGQFGPYEIPVSYTQPATAVGQVEVFQYSAKDGSEVDKVIVPVRFY